MKNIYIVCLIMLVIMIPASASGACLADISNNGDTDLQDSIISLQIASGMNSTINVFNALRDINGDGKIGTEEAAYILQVMANLRPEICTGVWDDSKWDNSLWD
jgi:hypothetical protein